MAYIHTNDNRIRWNEIWRTWSAKKSDFGCTLDPVLITDFETGFDRKYRFQYIQVNDDGKAIAWWFAAEDGTKLKIVQE